MTGPVSTRGRYAFAALVIAATLLVRFLMAPLWETTAPFALFMFATVIAAWFAGTGPALLTGAAGFATRIYFDAPVDSGVLPVTWEEAVRLTLFAGFIAGTAVVLARMKADRLELERRIAVARAEIEERRRIEDKLRAARADAEEANRLKDEFLAMVSHELRTPLNAILGWVSLLRGGSLSPPRALHALDVIQRNARAQAQIVGDLLDVARSLTGRLYLHASHVDFVPLVIEAAGRFRREAEDKAVTLSMDIPREELRVWGDPERLTQIVVNLVGNAVKFTAAGGGVDVRLFRCGSQVELTVTDTGAGIAPEFLPYVFERFTQAETGSTRRHGGLGLGLTIVRQLVELHRGHIMAESEGKERGARFTVRLPLHTGAADPEDLAPARAARAADPRTLSDPAATTPPASAGEI